MQPSEPDLEELTSLLGQCLGRIDEQAFRIQRGDDEDDAATHVLEEEASRLQNLVASLLDAVKADVGDSSDLNRTLERVVRETVPQLQYPVVIRQRLGSGLLSIACRPNQLAHAVQRVLLLTTAFAGQGGVVELTTRLDDGVALLEASAYGQGNNCHLHERATTLTEFVASWKGRCRIDVDARGELLMALELPTAFEPEDR
jgi:signal transduction histidine kinase